MTTLALVGALWPLLIGMGARPPVSTPDGYSSLDRFIEVNRLTVERSDHRDTLILSRPNARLVLHENSRRALYNGMLVWLNAPAARSGKAFQVAMHDLTHTLDPVLNAPALLKRRSAPPRLIMLDPGHGGADCGAVVDSLVEKELTLAIALQTATVLERAGFAVQMTRTNDTTLTLDSRVAAANNAKADLFVSIHFNQAANPDASGIETFVIAGAHYPSTSGGMSAGVEATGNAHETEAMALASQVHSALLWRTGATDRGIKRARFKLLRDVNCPAILVECGFLSSASEAARLSQPFYRTQLSHAIAHGVIRYMTMAGARSARAKPPPERRP